MKRVVGFLLAVILVLGWAYADGLLGPDPITRVQAAKLMNRYPDGKFHAEGKITRAQLASIIVKTFNLSERNIPSAQANQPIMFPNDVPANHWAAQDIWIVLKHGAMEGYRELAFHPDYPVSRAEALAILAHAFGVYQYDDTTVNEVLADYPDAGQIPSWARKSMATALKSGFVNVDSVKRIRPAQPMTRGDMAYALSEYLYRVEEAARPSLNPDDQNPQ